MNQKQHLTGREQEILQMILDDKNSGEISAMLDISVRTVEAHRRNIALKTNAHSVVSLITYAIREGWFENYYYQES